MFEASINMYFKKGIRTARVSLSIKTVNEIRVLLSDMIRTDPVERIARLKWGLVGNVGRFTNECWTKKIRE